MVGGTTFELRVKRATSGAGTGGNITDWATDEALTAAQGAAQSAEVFPVRLHRFSPRTGAELTTPLIKGMQVYLVRNPAVGDTEIVWGAKLKTEALPSQ